MRFKFLFLPVLCFCICTQLFADRDYVSQRPAHFLHNVEDFEGDQYGDFVGDPMVTLEDGSQWKIHPSNLARFEGWRQGDRVQIQKRTSFYWFKREHKFKMYNETRDEYVKVMFVGYPDPYLFIEATDQYLAESYSRPYETIDAEGRRHVRYENVKKYHKDIRLSDGRIFTLKDESDFENFRMGAKVYVGANPGSHFKENYFIIHGTEREAVWAWVH